MKFRLGITDSGRRLSTGLVCLAFATQLAGAQTPTLKTRTKEQREEQFAATHRITMNVQVTDAAGNPVSDLRAADITLYDNHQPRKIVAFHGIDGTAMYDATEIVILLDAVNSSAQALDTEKSAIFKYLAQSHKPFSYPTSFALWSNGHLKATPATTDRNAVGRAFVSVTKNLHSNACSELSPAEQKVAINKGNEKVDPATCRAVHVRDSIAALDGIALQQMVVGGRTLLIWVGAGWPELSDAEFQSLTPKEQREYSQDFVTMLHDLRAGQVTLYSIAPAVEIKQAAEGDAADKPAVVRVDDPPPSTAAHRLALPELTERTGGRLMAASHDVTEDLGSCVHDADWYYAVSFNAPPAQNGAGEMHSLEIKVNRPGLQVRTMTTYYPEP